jgi:hypothetical protein
VVEISEWNSIVSNVENRANVCKTLDGKLLFNAFYGMYAVTLNELMTVLEVSGQAAQSGAVNKTSRK